MQVSWNVLECEYSIVLFCSLLPSKRNASSVQPKTKGKKALCLYKQSVTVLGDTCKCHPVLELFFCWLINGIVEASPSKCNRNKMAYVLFKKKKKSNNCFANPVCFANFKIEKLSRLMMLRRQFGFLRALILSSVNKV